MNEKTTYRDNLESLLAFFGKKRLLTKTDVGKYLGIDYRTAAKRYGIDRNGITVESLARQIAR